MFENGYWRVGRIRGVPVRFHWSVPLGALAFGRLDPAIWVAFVGIVFIHELGHAAVVWRYRHRVVSIDVTGFGGLCRWSGNPSRFERAAIAWGGVLAQAVLLTVAVVLAAAGVWGAIPRGSQLGDALIYTNLMIIALNLLPLRPLDGAEAWPLLGMLPEVFGRWRARKQGRALWQQIMQRPVPKRRVVRRRTESAGADSSPGAPPSEGAGPRPGNGAGPANREIADLLRKIGDEARKARRPSDEEK